MTTRYMNIMIVLLLVIGQIANGVIIQRSNDRLGDLTERFRLIEDRATQSVKTENPLQDHETSSHIAAMESAIDDLYAQLDISLDQFDQLEKRPAANAVIEPGEREGAFEVSGIELAHEFSQKGMIEPDDWRQFDDRIASMSGEENAAFWVEFFTAVGNGEIQLVDDRHNNEDHGNMVPPELQLATDQNL